VTRRRGRRRKKLLDGLTDRRGYCQLEEENLDRTMWRNRFGRGFGPVVWQITDDDDDDEFLRILGTDVLRRNQRDSMPHLRSIHPNACFVRI